ncbi:MAG TPA: alpha/beta hydrolase, partial [Rhodospirillaceae bacterium]|nr:alpha/beta hydrolase [Rhodospirillaceae bacterium]
MRAWWVWLCAGGALPVARPFRVWRGGGLLSILIVCACAPTVLPPGPAVTRPALEDGGFVAADGARLPVRAWMPRNGDPKAVIVALHGFNDYSNFFAEPGAFLAGQGLAAYAYDQRGFGEAPNRGLWPGSRAFVDDLKAVTAAVRGRHPGVPLYLLGESMGGAVIMVAMTDADAPDVDGVILAAPAVWGRTAMPWYQRAALFAASHTMPALRVTGQGLKIKASDNNEMLRALGRDPLVIKETRIDAISGLTNLMDSALESAFAFDASALILIGERDEIIPSDPTRLLIRRLPRNGRHRYRLAFYANGYHMLLRDLQAETVWKDIAAWIADTAAPLPSAADKRAAAERARRS